MDSMSGEEERQRQVGRRGPLDTIATAQPFTDSAHTGDNQLDNAPITVPLISQSSAWSRLAEPVGESISPAQASIPSPSASSMALRRVGLICPRLRMAHTRTARTQPMCSGSDAKSNIPQRGAKIVTSYWADIKQIAFELLHSRKSGSFSGLPSIEVTQFAP